MHDPYTQAFAIRYPWRNSSPPTPLFPDGYRDTFATIWHVDPEKGGDDSCDWFGWHRPLDPRERALLEALSDLEHRLGNPPYYPTLYPKREIDALRAAECAWRKRSRWIHPRWHVWHWKITIYPIQNLKRWLFTRCAGCAGRFAWGEAPVTGQWESPGPRWFRGEKHLYHDRCFPRPVATATETAKAVA